MNVCFGKFGQPHSIASLRFWPLEPFLFYFLLQNITVSKVLGQEGQLDWRPWEYGKKVGMPRGHLTWEAG
jgi:hypothetical protein